MPVEAAVPDHSYAPRLRLKDARPVMERASEAAARALPPEPPPARPLINSEGQAIGTRIDTTA